MITPDLKSYLATPIATGPPRESPWIDAGSVEVPSGRILIADPIFMEGWEPLSIRPGTLALRVIFLDFGGRRLVARIRTGGTPASELGGEVATLIVDSAQVGVCDQGRYARATKGLTEEGYEAKLALTQTDDPVGSLDWGDAAPMIFFSSGFGDGRYPVRELLEGGERVGFEVDFDGPEDDD